MTFIPPFLQRGLVVLLLGVLSLSAFAHGDEPHGDEPHGNEAASGAAGGAPRIESATDLFEMVARRQDEALTLFINRFETNEPVLQARVEVESGTSKAVAEFQADQGSYVVRDAAFLDAIARPGTHALVVTVLAGDDADLLEGSLTVEDGAQDPADAKAASGAPVVPVLGGLLAAGAVAAGAFYLRRRKATEGETR